VVLFGFGHKNAHDKLQGCTIFQDSATGIIWVESQVSLGAGETIMSKLQFEEWLWEIASAETSHLHSDNGVFASGMF
jgi:hypothetical protein